MEEGDGGSNSRSRFWCRIVMLTAGAFALEFSYSVEASFGVPAMLKAGLSEKYASIMWAVGPVLGLLFQSYLGAASDRCTSPWGRRRPFILALAVCVCCTVGLFPYGKSLSDHVLHLRGSSGSVFVMVFTAASFVLMDFSLDAFQSPVRAYLLDSVPVNHSERANHLFTLMLGLGATFGSMLSAIPYEKLGVVGAGDLDTQVKVTFGLSLVVMVVSVAVTLNSVSEKSIISKAVFLPVPVVEVDSREAIENDSKSAALQENKESWETCERECNDKRNCSSRGRRLETGLKDSRCNSPVVLKTGNIRSKSPSPNLVLPARAHCLCMAELFQTFHGTFRFARSMSRHFFSLWLLMVFSQIAFLPQYLFFTNFVGEVVYGGSPTSPQRSVRELYTEGVRGGCWLLMVSCLVVVLFSLLSKWLSKYASVRLLFIGGHVLFLVALIATMTQPSLLTVLVLSASAGLYYANLQSIPYSLAQHYHEAGMLLRKSSDEGSDVTGKAVAFLVMAMFVAQLLLATSLGLMIEAYGSSYVVIIVSFVGECLAGISLLFVKFRTERAEGVQ